MDYEIKILGGSCLNNKTERAINISGIFGFMLVKFCNFVNFKFCNFLLYSVINFCIKGINSKIKFQWWVNNSQRRLLLVRLYIPCYKIYNKSVFTDKINFQ